MFRDTTITGKQKKRELLIYLACLAGAVIFNIIAIIRYSSPAKELYTQLHIVLLVSLFFYVLVTFFRIVFWLVRRLLKGKASAS